MVPSIQPLVMTDLIFSHALSLHRPYLPEQEIASTQTTGASCYVCLQLGLQASLELESLCEKQGPCRWEAGCFDEKEAGDCQHPLAVGCLDEKEAEILVERPVEIEVVSEMLQELVVLVQELVVLQMTWLAPVTPRTAPFSPAAARW